MSSLLAIGIMGATGFLAKWLCHVTGFPVIVGYIAVGVAIGPLGLGMISTAPSTALIQVVVGFAALMLGKELKWSLLKKISRETSVILLLTSVMPALLVGLSIWVLTRSLPLSIILAVITPSTAPAVILSAIFQYQARGPVTQRIKIIVAVDDGVTIVLAYLSIPVIVGYITGSYANLITSHYYLLLGIAIGIVAGFMITVFLTCLREYSTQSAFLVAVVLLLTGLHAWSALLPLLASLVAGIVLANTRPTSRAFWHRMEEFLDYIYLLFFVYLGTLVSFDTNGLVWFITGVYVVARITGKYFGGLLAVYLMEDTSSRYRHIGLALLPHGTISLLIATVVEQDFPSLQGLLIKTVLAATIVFELLGPFFIKRALQVSGETHHQNGRLGFKGG